MKTRKCPHCGAMNYCVDNAREWECHACRKEIIYSCEVKRLKLSEIPANVLKATLKRWTSNLERDSVEWESCPICYCVFSCADCPLPEIVFQEKYVFCNSDSIGSALCPHCNLYGTTAKGKYTWQDAAEAFIKILESEIEGRQDHA